MSRSALDVAPSTRLFYAGPWRSKPERAIYLLDQAMAKAHIDYFAAITHGDHVPSFTVYVRARNADRAKVEIENLQSRYA